MDPNIHIGTSIAGTGFAPIAGYSVPQLIYVSLELIFILATVGSFFFLLWGGVQWILSGGDKEGIEKARKKIVNAIVGLAITLSIYALSSIIDAVFFGGAGGIFRFTIPSLTDGGGSSFGSSSGSSRTYGSTSPGTDGKTWVWTKAGDSCPTRGGTLSYDFWCQQ